MAFIPTPPGKRFLPKTSGACSNQSRGDCRGHLERKRGTSPMILDHRVKVVRSRAAGSGRQHAKGDRFDVERWKLGVRCFFLSKRPVVAASGSGTRQVPRLIRDNRFL